MNSNTSTRTNAKDAKGAVERLGRIRRLTDDDIRVAISYPEEDLDKREYCANVGVVTLLIVIAIAFVTLLFMLPSGSRQRVLQDVSPEGQKKPEKILKRLNKRAEIWLNLREMSNARSS